MAKCSKCGKKIRYNDFMLYRRKVLCGDCYKHRNDKKPEPKTEEAKTEELKTEPLENSDSEIFTNED